MIGGGDDRQFVALPYGLMVTNRLTPHRLRQGDARYSPSVIYTFHQVSHSALRDVVGDGFVYPILTILPRRDHGMRFALIHPAEREQVTAPLILNLHEGLEGPRYGINFASQVTSKV